MKIVWARHAWEDYRYWQESDPDVVCRINDLIKATTRDPFTGIGKPEPLKGGLKGWWSRRITGEHRLVYRVTGAGDEQAIEIAQCHYHY